MSTCKVEEVDSDNSKGVEEVSSICMVVEEVSSTFKVVERGIWKR